MKHKQHIRSDMTQRLEGKKILQEICLYKLFLISLRGCSNRWRWNILYYRKSRLWCGDKWCSTVVRFVWWQPQTLFYERATAAARYERSARRVASFVNYGAIRWKVSSLRKFIHLSTTSASEVGIPIREGLLCGGLWDLSNRRTSPSQRTLLF